MAKLKPKPETLSPETLNSLICASLNAIDDWCETGEGRTEWPPEMVEALCYRSMLLAAEINELIGYIESRMPGMVAQLRKEHRARFEFPGEPA